MYTLLRTLAYGIILGSGLLLLSYKALAGTGRDTCLAQTETPGCAVLPPEYSMRESDAAGGGIVLHTAYGTLALGASNGQAAIAGLLARPTACTEWEAAISSGPEAGPLVIEISSRDWSEVCLNEIAPPQLLLYNTTADADSLYVLRVNGDTIYAGVLPAAPAEERAHSI